ncbi:MAG TPA: branched-chain amino acid ABC transporter permease [Methylomirabilota bacterium]|nr:branched-chain amino acid ABC transporter permease [Methylomirabilota bacterium]
MSARAGLTPRVGWRMLGLFAALATTPFWIERVGLYQYLGVEILVWATFAMAFNLLLGYTGLPSFGHGAYFGVGAYAVGLAQHHLGAGLWLGLACAVLLAAVSGAAVAAFLSHRRGIYFALMSIAFGQVFWFVAIKWHAVTGGEDGLLRIRRPPADLGLVAFDLTGNVALFYFVLVVFAVVTLGLGRLVRSPFGMVLQAIRQNEARAAFIGHDVWLHKWLAFTLSAALSGLSGGLFALVQMSAFPDVMSLHASGNVVMMTLVGGGLVSFYGPLAGTVVYFLARDVLGALTGTWMLWFGLLFMGVVLFKPEGLAGLFPGRVAAKAAPAPTLASLLRRG